MGEWHLNGAGAASAPQRVVVCTAKYSGTLTATWRADGVRSAGSGRRMGVAVRALFNVAGGFIYDSHVMPNSPAGVSGSSSLRR